MISALLILALTFTVLLVLGVPVSFCIGIGTLLSLMITYANAEQRDAILATGMTGGMETSYARLEGLLETVTA